MRPPAEVPGIPGREDAAPQDPVQTPDPLDPQHTWLSEVLGGVLQSKSQLERRPQSSGQTSVLPALLVLFTAASASPYRALASRTWAVTPRGDGASAVSASSPDFHAQGMNSLNLRR